MKLTWKLKDIVIVFFIAALIASTFAIILFLLRGAISLIVVYILILFIVWVFLTKATYRRNVETIETGFRKWIRQNFCFLALLDFHLLFVLLGWIVPSARGPFFIPEILLGLNLVLLGLVRLKEKRNWFINNEFIFRLIVHVISYTFVAITFFIIIRATMMS